MYWGYTDSFCQKEFGLPCYFRAPSSDNFRVSKEEVHSVAFQVLEEGGAAEVHRLNQQEHLANDGTSAQETVIKSLSETLDDEVIDKLLDQFLASATNKDDERKQKVKAASIINLLSDDLIEQFVTADKVAKTKKSDGSEKAEAGRPADEL